MIQIFSNLLDNALRFTPKGKVTFGITKISDTEVECFVSDTGIGIQAEKQRLIFERFSQADNTTSRSYGGTGLGLTIVRKLAELMGSEIFLQSEPGKGSRFWFSLPYSTVVAQKSKTPQKTATIPIKSNATKILVVEDDPASKIYFERILDHSFEKIIFAASGKQALELYEKELPDIILLDIGLPDIHGFDVTRKIREKDNNVIIIAQTAYAMANDEQKAIEAGCNDYIAKPIKKELLFEKLTKRR